MLAALKLGGPWLIPTAGLLARRICGIESRGEIVRQFVTGSGNACEGRERLGGDFTRIAVGEPTPGWLDFAQSSRFPATFTPTAERAQRIRSSSTSRRDDHGQRKLVLHTHQIVNPVKKRHHLDDGYRLEIREASSPGRHSSPPNTPRLLQGGRTNTTPDELYSLCAALERLGERVFFSSSTPTTRAALDCEGDCLTCGWIRRRRTSRTAMPSPAADRLAHC
jgi:hypothetical protein